MRKNFVQSGKKSSDERTYIDGDWYSYGIPGNVKLAKNVYIDTSYGYAAFHSLLPEGMIIGEASGCYDRATSIVSGNGMITVGKYNILNGCTLVCKSRITIGDHCMLAWGSVITDSWIDGGMLPVEKRKHILETVSKNADRHYPFFGEGRPVILEDNCWVGFDAVILPGVRLGRGCVVGCKTIVDFDVPPYAVVSGMPAKIVKYLDATDIKQL